ncbi:hypothetical protein C3747_13g21 [Trypanosoma cruzi]|uniref:Uncharacterized protein n=2 Tax=Trypanosoma cruzi TaxID=5693 RepID=Q4D4B6_TRYCC|nr:hypothetical protein, conserved [Trypanosoma cruzi]EAN87374.1 hypothetical protein, conserved [Trypanosoma cruzi]PWV18369.1 hypothetical protein C3747_13g21 [Trypanosoma cruzi]RNC61751.1 hypothetical protein TcCL_ESM00602 [Trypanosoma cruzi]|eukprot:XP_809225.1 hypothetical protein [Trypanosoma cruzi strain CL Brener]
MTNMEKRASAFSTASPIHLDCPAASCPFGHGANNGDNNRTESHDESMHRGSSFPPVVSHNLCDELGNCFMQPPIALLSRRRYQDPAVMRLHAALAFREMRSSANESPEPQASSSWTTNSAASPKNSLSIGYDDDAMSSFLSTPANGSPIKFFRRAKSLVFPSVRSSASLASGDEVNHVSSVVETTTKLKNCPFMNFYWNSQQQQQQQQQGIEDGQEGLIETEKQEETIEGVQAPCFIFDAMAGPSQGTERGMSDSDVQFRGVPTDSSADNVAAWEMDDRERKSHDVDDDAALSHHEDDEVVGVTAEGNFIYRRDIDAEGSRFVRGKVQHHQDDRPFPDECGDADTFPAFIPTAPFCTPERNIFATVLSDRAAVPNSHEERVGVWKNAAAASTTASLTNGAAFPRGGSIGRSRQKKAPEWTPIDAEWCSLLLRYRVCENADETEYKELISAVNKWHEVRLRYPMEALERRLREGESYDRPPFVLRW